VFEGSLDGAGADVAVTSRFLGQRLQEGHERLFVGVAEGEAGAGVFGEVGAERCRPPS